MEDEENVSRWSLDELKLLVDRVSCVKDLQRKKYSTVSSASKVKWDTIHIDGKDAKGCEAAFKQMTNYVYRHITVGDVCGLAREVLDKPVVPLDMVPNAPKRPTTAYFLFSASRNKSLRKDHPEKTFTELSRMAQEEWKTMSDDDKRQYFDEYRGKMETYENFQRSGFVTGKKAKGSSKEKVAASSSNNSNSNSVAPDVNSKEHNKIVTFSPFEVFWQDNNDYTSKNEARQAFNKIDDEELLEWIWKSIKVYTETKASAQEEDEPVPLYHLKESEKKVLCKSEGVFDKPPKTLLAFYRLQHKDMDLEVANIRYREMDGEETERVVDQYQQELVSFCARLTKYLEKRRDSMTPDEVKELDVVRWEYERIVKKLDVKIDKGKKRKGGASSEDIEMPPPSKKSKTDSDSVQSPVKSSQSPSKSISSQSPKKKKVLGESGASVKWHAIQEEDEEEEDSHQVLTQGDGDNHSDGEERKKKKKKKKSKDHDRDHLDESLSLSQEYQSSGSSPDKKKKKKKDKDRERGGDDSGGDLNISSSQELFENHNGEKKKKKKKDKRRTSID